MRLRGMERCLQQQDKNRSQRREMDGIVEQCKQGDYSQLVTLERYYAVNEVLRRNFAKPEDLKRWQADARTQARQQGLLLHEVWMGGEHCMFCEQPIDQWFSSVHECKSYKAAIELFEPGTSLQEMLGVCYRWTMLAAFQQDQLIRQVQTKEYDRLEQYLSATPLAELHITTPRNGGNHLTVEEARDIVKIIRAEITV